jgi:hypothetical protein
MTIMELRASLSNGACEVPYLRSVESMEDDPNASQRVKAFGQPEAPFVVGN